ncbi:unnamed protein product [Effrenium voratum]|nr:unnamed protein product [Effrenium voratum]
MEENPFGMRWPGEERPSPLSPALSPAASPAPKAAVPFAVPAEDVLKDRRQSKQRELVQLQAQLQRLKDGGIDRLADLRHFVESAEQLTLALESDAEANPGLRQSLAAVLCDARLRPSLQALGVDVPAGYAAAPAERPERPAPGAPARGSELRTPPEGKVPNVKVSAEDPFFVCLAKGDAAGAEAAVEKLRGARALPPKSSAFSAALAHGLPGVAWRVWQRFPPEHPSGVEVSECDASGDSLLHSICRSKKFDRKAFELFSQLLRAVPAELRCHRNGSGQSFLHVAAARLNTQILAASLTDFPALAPLFAQQDSAGASPMSILAKHLAARGRPQPPCTEQNKAFEAHTPSGAEVEVEVEDEVSGKVCLRFKESVLRLSQRCSEEMRTQSAKVKVDPGVCRSARAVSEALNFLTGQPLTLSESRELWQLLSFSVRYRLPRELRQHASAALLDRLKDKESAAVLPMLVRGGQAAGLTAPERRYVLYCMLTSPEALASAGPGPRWGGLLGVIQREVFRGNPRRSDVAVRAVAQSGLSARENEVLLAALAELSSKPAPGEVKEKAEGEADGTKKVSLSDVSEEDKDEREEKEAETGDELDKATEMAGFKPFSKLRSERSKSRSEAKPDRAGAETSPPKARSGARSPRSGKGHGPSGPKLNRSRQRLGDQDLRRMQDLGGFEEVDFSRNNLSSEGVGPLLEICKRCPDLKILKLFNNQLGDDGAEELGQMFKYCHAIEEVHLSHNNFTARGVESMVKAANRELPRKAVRPLWLRMEHNKVQDTEGLARDLERHYPAVCGREDRGRCTPRVCAKGRRIHLPFLIEVPKGSGRERGQRMRPDQRRERFAPRRRSRSHRSHRSPRARSRRSSRRSRRRLSPRRPLRRTRTPPRRVRARTPPPSPSPSLSRSPSRRPCLRSAPRKRPRSPSRSASQLPAEVTKLRPKAKARPRIPRPAPKRAEEPEYSYYSEYEYEYSYV